MDAPATFGFTYVALLVILALGAVGVIIMLKVLRGRQAARGDMDTRLDTAAPVDPMSRGHANRMMTRYAWVAGAVVAVLVVAALFVYGR